jgi:hypothetical protein
MLLANSYFRAVIFSLVSLGMVVPGWATQPCKCSEKDGCCTAHEVISSSCCAERPCCAARSDPHRVETACVAESVGCPCCSEAAPPTNTAQQQPTFSQDEQQPAGIAANQPARIPPVEAIDYLTRSLGSPPGHPDLRLHALYRVWLN